MAQLGLLLTVLQGFNQGVGQGWILIWKPDWETRVVTDSIQFPVVVGLRASAFCFGVGFFCLFGFWFLVFLVIITYWVEVSPSLQRPPTLLCHVGFPNMAIFLPHSQQGRNSSKTGSTDLYNIITSLCACNHIQPSTFSVFCWLEASLSHSQGKTLAGGDHRNHLKNMSAMTDLKIMQVFLARWDSCLTKDGFCT